VYVLRVGLGAEEISDNDDVIIAHH